ncbi:MAG: hypothetical protein KF705_05235 [Phycisphaeraceae bacterium]|nr:hypothetical protein [Phycisphaeraceae bacterium]
MSRGRRVDDAHRGDRVSGCGVDESGIVDDPGEPEWLIGDEVGGGPCASSDASAGIEEFGEETIEPTLAERPCWDAYAVVENRVHAEHAPEAFAEVGIVLV